MGCCELRKGSGGADSRRNGSSVQCDKRANVLCFYSLVEGEQER
jgi:hypothetical protein